MSSRNGAGAERRPGRRMDLRLIARTGELRERLLREAEDALDVVADELLEAGELANVNLAAKLSGVSRTTLYRRMDARRAARKENTR